MITNKLAELLSNCAIPKFDTNRYSNVKKIIGISGVSFFRLDKVLENREEIKSIIDQLHDNFDNGWSYTQINRVKDGSTWTDKDTQMELLLMLGLASGLLEFCSKRGDWHKLPNGMPYIRRVDDKSVFDSLKESIDKIPTFDKIDEFEFDNDSKVLSSNGIKSITINYEDGSSKDVDSCIFGEILEDERTIGMKFGFLNINDDKVDYIIEFLDKMSIDLKEERLKSLLDDLKEDDEYLEGVVNNLKSILDKVKNL